MQSAYRYNRCDHCGSKEELLKGAKAVYKICGGCRFVHYCSFACQKKDWASHKKNCSSGPSAKTLNKLALQLLNKIRDSGSYKLHIPDMVAMGKRVLGLYTTYEVATAALAGSRTDLMRVTPWNKTYILPQVYDESYFFTPTVSVDGQGANAVLPLNGGSMEQVLIDGTNGEKVDQVFATAREEEAIIPINIRNLLEKFKIGKIRHLFLYIYGKKRDINLRYLLHGQ